MRFAGLSNFLLRKRSSAANNCTWTWTAPTAATDEYVSGRKQNVQHSEWWGDLCLSTIAQFTFRFISHQLSTLWTNMRPNDRPNRMKECMCASAWPLRRSEKHTILRCNSFLEHIKLFAGSINWLNPGWLLGCLAAWLDGGKSELKRLMETITKRTQYFIQKLNCGKLPHSTNASNTPTTVRKIETVLLRCRATVSFHVCVCAVCCVMLMCALLSHSAFARLLASYLRTRSKRFSHKSTTNWIWFLILMKFLMQFLAKDRFACPYYFHSKRNRAPSILPHSPMQQKAYGIFPDGNFLFFAFIVWCEKAQDSTVLVCALHV